MRVDDEGFFYVVDRKKDMIISGGENIYCAEVENALAAHPNVLEVSVIGRPHERWGETPVAVIVPRDSDADLTVAEIRQWAQGCLAKYKLPTEVHIVRELPRNAGGKVVKARCVTHSVGGSSARHPGCFEKGRRCPHHTTTTYSLPEPARSCG